MGRHQRAGIAVALIAVLGGLVPLASPRRGRGRAQPRSSCRTSTCRASISAIGADRRAAGATPVFGAMVRACETGGYCRTAVGRRSRAGTRIDGPHRRHLQGPGDATQCVARPGRGLVHAGRPGRRVSGRDAHRGRGCGCRGHRSGVGRGPSHRRNSERRRGRSIGRRAGHGEWLGRDRDGHYGGRWNVRRARTRRRHVRPADRGAEHPEVIAAAPLSVVVSGLPGRRRRRSWSLARTSRVRRS